jgi:hypothetical protein
MLLPCSDLEYRLSDAGAFSMPDLRSLVKNTEYPGPTALSQTPPPGAPFSGKQVVYAEVLATNQSGKHETCRFKVAIVDKTKPAITVTLQSSAQQLRTPSGIPYFRTPASVTANIIAADAVDPQPFLERFLDGQPYSGGAVTSTGFHSIGVRAIDQSGNVATEAFLFQIVDRYQHSGRVVVENYYEVPGTNGIAGIGVTLLVAGTAFAARDLHLATIAVWFTDSTGRWLHAESLGILGGITSPAGAFSYATAQAEYEQCYWRMEFFGDFTGHELHTSPAKIEVVGSGLHFDSDAIDFTAQTPAAEVPDPLSALQDIIIGCPEPPDPPDPPEQPEPPCRFNQWWSIWEADDEEGEGIVQPCIPEGAEGEWHYELHARHNNIMGHGYARDQCIGLGAACSSAVQGGGLYKARFEPQGCCGSCQIEVSARPKYKVHVRVNPPAAAAGVGHLGVSSGTWGVHASGGLAIGDWGTQSINLGGYDIPVTEAVHDITQSFDALPPYSTIVNNCSVNVWVATAAAVSVSANNSVINATALAESRVFEADLRLHVFGECLDDPPPGGVLSFTLYNETMD